MMENKYYTPSIKEFHVGFQYEELTGTESTGFQDWSERIYSITDFIDSYGESSLESLIEGDCIRVECLNEGDFKNLGFIEVTKQDPYNNDRRNFARYKDNVNILTKDFKKIQISRPDVIRTKNPDGTYKWRILFEGNIKNKSVFEQILKMIGVIE